MQRTKEGKGEWDYKTPVSALFLSSDCRMEAAELVPAVVSPEQVLKWVLIRAISYLVAFLQAVGRIESGEVKF